MPLQHLIAHRVTRPTPDVPCQVKLASEELTANGLAQEWLHDMKYSVLKRSGKEYGRFSDNLAEHPLPAWLAEFQAEKIGFTNLAEKLAQQFKLQLDNSPAFVDGFLVVAVEILEQDTQLHVFFVQHEHCIYLDGDLQLSQSLKLDTDNIRLSLKVSFDDWQSDEAYRQSNALTLLRWRGEKDLSDAFANAMAFAEKLDIAAETEVFLSQVEAYTQAMPEELAHHTRKEVVDYCLEQESKGKPIVMRELNSHIQDRMPEPAQSHSSYTPPPSFERFVETQGQKTKPEFRTDKTQLRNYIRISGRNELLSMSFASSCLGDTVIYDAQSDSLTIKSLPSALKSKLKKIATQKDDS